MWFSFSSLLSQSAINADLLLEQQKEEEEEEELPLAISCTQVFQSFVVKKVFKLKLMGLTLSEANICFNLNFVFVPPKTKLSLNSGVADCVA